MDKLDHKSQEKESTSSENNSQNIDEVNSNQYNNRHRNNNNNNNNNNNSNSNHRRNQSNFRNNFRENNHNNYQRPNKQKSNELPPRFRTYQHHNNYQGPSRQKSNELPPRFRTRQHHNNSDPLNVGGNYRECLDANSQRMNQDLADSFDRMTINQGNYHLENSPSSSKSNQKNFDDENVPSTSYHARNNRRSNNNGKNKVRANLESQREIMDELLRKAQYECIVCCDKIKIHERTWNCSSCFNVFHLKCIQQWAHKSSVNPNENTGDQNSNNNVSSTNELERNNQNRTNRDNKKNNTEWRCPTCQSIQRKYPNAYYCFCGKVKEPELSNYRVPHSCGEMCTKLLELFNIKLENEDYFECKHRCTLMCHPGKCPQCTIKTLRICACKKTKAILKCSAKLSDIKCPELCNKLLNCLKHRCERTCHFGTCDPCEKIFEMKCFCGKETREGVPCTEFEQGFSCNQKCSKLYSCGAHICQDICHSGSCGTCPYSPQSVTHCPCGKTKITAIANYKPRSNCLDSIPVCGKICDKQLPCGNSNDKPHRCKSFCHSGDCSSCDSTTIIRCICGANSQKINCKDLVSRNFQCKRKCNKKLSCGRHKCLKECCTDREHICKQVCGRKLVCGQHNCSEPCHQVCRSCPNVIWTEVFCNCGAEFLSPPLPCGTPKPACKRPCSRQHPCEHPPRHPCHDEPECPPCVEFVSRLCYGEHEILTWIPCHETGVSCGRFCQKPLPCGQHKCSKVCHDGECPKCTQKCVQIRLDCLHPCGLPCHQNTSSGCPESPCREKIKIYCECEFKSKEVECNEVMDFRRFQQYLDEILKKFSFNTSITLEEMKEMVRHNVLHSLECDQECAKEKRNKNLVEAFGIDPNGQPMAMNVKYSDQLKNEARANPHFIMTIHDKFVQLIDAFKQSNQKIMCYNFAAMNRNCREIIHNYAAYFGLKTESVDKEPNRSVIITANKMSTAPKISLLDAVNIDVKELRPKQSVVKFKRASEENKNKKIINHFED